MKSQYPRPAAKTSQIAILLILQKETMSLPRPYTCDDVDLLRQVSADSTQNLEEALESDEVDLLLALDSNKDATILTAPPPPTMPFVDMPAIDMTIVDDAVETLLDQAQRQQQHPNTSNTDAAAGTFASPLYFGRRHSMGSAPMPVMPTTTLATPHSQVAPTAVPTALDVAPLDVFHQDQYVRVSDQAMPFDSQYSGAQPLGRRHSLHSSSHMPSMAYLQRQQEQLPFPFYDEVTTVQVFPPSAQQQQELAASGNQNVLIADNTSTAIAMPQPMAAHDWYGSAGFSKPTAPATTAPSTRTCSPSSEEGMLTVLPQNNDVTIPFQQQDDITVFNQRAYQEDLQPLDLQDFPLEEVDQADIFDTFEALPQKVPAAPTRPSLLASQQTSCRSLDGHHHSDGTLTLANSTSNKTLHVEDVGQGETTLPPSGLAIGSKSSPSMDRLRALMAKSIESMKLLEEHDRRQGLRKCDAQNMMNTARSRKQILENRILKKWDGTPLIAFEKCNKTGSITVSTGPKKVRMTKRRASLAGKAVDSIQDRRRMARRSSM